jgi:hypothetical protein
MLYIYISVSTRELKQIRHFPTLSLPSGISREMSIGGTKILKPA